MKEALGLFGKGEIIVSEKYYLANEDFRTSYGSSIHGAIKEFLTKKSSEIKQAIQDIKAVVGI